jgi:hypothetical protein
MPSKRRFRRVLISPWEENIFHYTYSCDGLIFRTISAFILLLEWTVLQMLMATTTAASTGKTTSSSCRLYLADSSLQNSGWGVFAGIDFQPGESLVRKERECQISKDDTPLSTRGEFSSHLSFQKVTTLLTRKLSNFVSTIPRGFKFSILSFLVFIFLSLPP